jgi:type I restriction enzyme S subunit
MSNSQLSTFNSQLILPGYKHTEVGVIPEDWKISNLGTHATFKTGPFGSALHQSDYVDDGVPVINPMQIVDGKIQPTPSMAITEEAARTLSEFRLSEGNVVIGRRGEMGRCAFVRAEEHGWLCGTGSMIIRTGPSLDARFIQRVLSSPPIIAEIENASVGSTMINLNQGTLGNLLVPLPPTKAEQEAIAETLSDADALIESLEQLLSKKRQVKQGAMQELLTGKKRLPGFSGEWEMKRIGELGNFLKGSGVTKDQTLTGNLPCVRYGEIYTRHNDYIKTFYSWISPDVAAMATCLRYGDILFAGSGETKEEIGKCVAFVNNHATYAGGDIVILRTEKADPLFLGYYLNTAPINRQKASRGQGDAVVHIGAVALAEIQGIFPSVPEQTAIAAILSDMDAETAALEAKLAKARQLKQGMMQELLTGRIRLVLPSESGDNAQC